MLGVGYVGLVSGTCFAEIGHQVVCIDVDEKKIKDLQKGLIPIYEPGLRELVIRNAKAGRLRFTSSYSSIRESRFVFLAVGTPSASDGSVNLDFLKAALLKITPLLSEDAIVVIKSTVPPGTANEMESFLRSKGSKKFYLASNPEFLREGSAVNDFMRPDRIVVGTADDVVFEEMKKLYAPVVRQGHPVFHMSSLSAELSKYASNAYLALKVSFINEIAQLCEVIKADVEDIRNVLKADPRIGGHFLYPGPGIGGSCLPKDIKGLFHLGVHKGLNLPIVSAIQDVNLRQRDFIVKKIKDRIPCLSGRKLAVWGVAFKAGTDDVRESPATALVDVFVQEGAHINFYDPVAADNFSLLAQKKWKGRIFSCDDKISCVEGVDALIILTEWREFKNPDWDKIKYVMNTPNIFDMRNICSWEEMKQKGFSYHALGRVF